MGGLNTMIAGALVWLVGYAAPDGLVMWIGIGVFVLGLGLVIGQGHEEIRDGLARGERLARGEEHDG